MEKREMPSGSDTREGKVVEIITRDIDSGETAENSKMGWEGKGISRAVVRSVIKQAAETQDTVTKNEFNWSVVRQLSSRQLSPWAFPDSGHSAPASSQLQVHP